jgi:hypothetical protein
MRIIGIFALAAAAMLAGEAVAAQPAPRQCFSTRDIQTVAPQDDFTVNIGTWSHDVYQAKTTTVCPGAGTGPALAYRSYSSRICSETDMSLVTGGPFGVRDCPLASLRKLTPQEIAALPKRARP